MMIFIKNPGKGACLLRSEGRPLLSGKAYRAEMGMAFLRRDASQIGGPAAGAFA